LLLLVNRWLESGIAGLERCDQDVHAAEALDAVEVLERVGTSARRQSHCRRRPRQLGPFRLSPTSPTCADTCIRDQFCHFRRVSPAYLTGRSINWRWRWRWWGRRRHWNMRPLSSSRRPRTLPELARLRSLYTGLVCSSAGLSLGLLGFTKTSATFLSLERVRDRHPSYGVLKNLLCGHLDPSHPETRRLLFGNGMSRSHFNRQARTSVLR